MLVLAFIGVLLSNLMSSGGWTYWKVIVPVYAILALWLSWYERRIQKVIRPATLWHEAFHWAALLLSFFLIELYVRTGLLSKTLASLFALTMLAFTVFTVGIYIESTFILIGIVLGVFAAVIAIAIEYFYAFTIPALLIGIGAISYVVWYSHRKISKNQ